jgi:hypothetical protein
VPSSIPADWKKHVDDVDDGMPMPSQSPSGRLLFLLTVVCAAVPVQASAAVTSLLLDFSDSTPLARDAESGETDASQEQTARVATELADVVIGEASPISDQAPIATEAAPEATATENTSPPVDAGESSFSFVTEAPPAAEVETPAESDDVITQVTEPLPQQETAEENTVAAAEIAAKQQALREEIERLALEQSAAISAEEYERAGVCWSLPSICVIPSSHSAPSDELETQLAELRGNLDALGGGQ